MDTFTEFLTSTSPAVALSLALLKASLLLAVIQLLVRMSHFSAAIRHLLLTAGIAGFLIIPLLSLAGPRWNFEIETSNRSETISTAHQTLAASGAASDVSFQMTAPAGTPARGRNFASLALVAWLAVALLVIARFAHSFIRLRSIVERASGPSSRLMSLLDQVRTTHLRSSSICLLRSDRISVPLVWGLRSGTMLVPAEAEQWSDERLRATFLHELGHLRRLDYLSIGIMNLVSAAFWFHPQIWLARRRALHEGERACDDFVLNAGKRA